MQEIIKKEDQKTISYDKTKYYFVISLTISVTSDYTQSKKAMNTIGGYYDVYTTHKRVIEVDHGGKGEWIIELIPYIKDVPAINNSIKYGCVLTAESTNNKDVYSEIEQHYIKQNTMKDEIANTIQPTSVMSQ